MSKPSTLVPLLIIAALFFIFGFVTWINGALIPFMKTINELTAAQSYLVASASYISFVVMALPSSAILEKTGYRKGMSIGLFVMALGALVFIPAANARTYWLFLVGIFIQGSGMTLLQTAANPYVTILGPIESAAKRISVLGIAHKVAGALEFRGPVAERVDHCALPWAATAAAAAAIASGSPRNSREIGFSLSSSS